MLETPNITKTYRQKKQLSLRGFANEINKELVNTGVSHTLVASWEREKKYYEPDMRLLFECIATYSDWRAEWARDCLKSMWPDLFMSGIVRVKLPKA